MTNFDEDDFEEEDVSFGCVSEVLTEELDEFFYEEFEEMTIEAATKKIKTDGDFMNRLKDKMLEILNQYKDVEVVIDLTE